MTISKEIMAILEAAAPEKCSRCKNDMEYLRNPACDGFYWDCFKCKDEAMLKVLFGYKQKGKYEK